MLAILFLVLSAIALAQTMIYPSDKPVLLTLLSWGIIMVIFLFGGFTEGYFEIKISSYLFVSWIIYCAIGKALSTFQKYAMQAYHNFNRKQVSGVSPLSCAIDLTASFCAIMQI